MVLRKRVRQKHEISGEKQVHEIFGEEQVREISKEEARKEKLSNPKGLNLKGDDILVIVVSKDGEDYIVEEVIKKNQRKKTRKKYKNSRILSPAELDDRFILSGM